MGPREIEEWRCGAGSAVRNLCGRLSDSASSCPRYQSLVSFNWGILDVKRCVRAGAQLGTGRMCVCVCDGPRGNAACAFPVPQPCQEPG